MSKSRTSDERSRPRQKTKGSQFYQTCNIHFDPRVRRGKAFTSATPKSTESKASPKLNPLKTTSPRRRPRKQRTTIQQIHEAAQIRGEKKGISLPSSNNFADIEEFTKSNSPPQKNTKQEFQTSQKGFFDLNSGLKKLNAVGIKVDENQEDLTDRLIDATARDLVRKVMNQSLTEVKHKEAVGQLENRKNDLLRQIDEAEKKLHELGALEENEKTLVKEDTKNETPPPSAFELPSAADYEIKSIPPRLKREDSVLTDSSSMMIYTDPPVLQTSIECEFIPWLVQSMQDEMEEIRQFQSTEIVKDVLGSIIQIASN